MKILDYATRTMSRFGHKINAVKPELFLIGGSICVVGGVVLACCGSFKLEKTLDNKKENINVLKDMRKADPDDKQVRNDLRKAYIDAGLAVGKLYAPCVLSLGTGLAMIIGGHNILRKENIAIAGAYKLVDEGFKKYRKNVVNELGEAMDRKFRFGTEEEEIEETYTDSKGKEKVRKKKIEKVSEAPDYTEFYQAGCLGWDKDYPSESKKFLLYQLANANKILRLKGVLTLNEVLEMLGIQQKAYGQIVGWRVGGDGDNEVSFGLDDYNNPETVRFLNGEENVVLLDFNCYPIIDVNDLWKPMAWS